MPVGGAPSCVCSAMEALTALPAELEQYTRMNDVIVTGLRIKPRSYARAVSADNGGEPGEQDIGSAEQQVAAFVQSKGTEVDCENMEACHPLPRRHDTDKAAIMIRFVKRKDKNAALKQGRMLRGSNVFIKQHVTKRAADIGRKAGFLKNQGQIVNPWSTKCKVFMK